MSVFPPRRIIRNSLQERKYQTKREKEVKKLSEKLNNQDSRSIEVSTSNKRIEYFPDEKLIIKCSGSAGDPLNIADDDTDIYSDDENPKVKKVANKIIEDSVIFIVQS
jgi:hypothetical protein